MFQAFNAFGCSYNQSSVLAQVDAMVKYGLVDAGYNVSISILLFIDLANAPSSQSSWMTASLCLLATKHDFNQI